MSTGYFLCISPWKVFLLGAIKIDYIGQHRKDCFHLCDFIMTHTYTLQFHWLQWSWFTLDWQNSDIQRKAEKKRVELLVRFLLALCQLNFLQKNHTKDWYNFVLNINDISPISLTLFFLDVRTIRKGQENFFSLRNYTCLTNYRKNMYITCFQW